MLQMKAQQAATLLAKKIKRKREAVAKAKADEEDKRNKKKMKKGTYGANSLYD